MTLSALDSQAVKTLVERYLLPAVQKPARYMGGELHSITKDPATVKVHGVFCFPDVYDIGMSHFGSQILYHIVNREPSFSLARAYTPWLDAEAIMRTQSIPLYELETFAPIAFADWIGFSLQYELQYTNVLTMLDLAGVPLLSSDRTSEHPLVIAGGPCASNPEPLAEYIDLFVLGDGEKLILSICKIIEQAKAQKKSRAETLQLVSALRGIYIPSLQKTAQQGSFVVLPDARFHADKIPVLESSNYPDHPLVPLTDVVHHRLAVEVMRGCTRGCRFCAAGMFYRPVRERPAEEIFNQIESSIANTGWQDATLLSLSSADYDGLPELLNRAHELKKRQPITISLPSTRIDALTPEEFAALNDIQPASSLTIAPEAGSQRLRDVINKGLSEAGILGMAEMLLSKNIQTLKLYFMIGLPTETDDDILELIALVKKLCHMARSISGRKKISVSVSPFSPKPHTPFQWEAMVAPAILASRGRRIKESLSSTKNCKVSWREGTITELETIIARGDRTIGKLIHAAWRMGARFDGWDEQFDIKRWYAASEQIGIDRSVYTNEIDTKQLLPWSHIDIGVSEEFLLTERRKAYAMESTEDCRTGNCTHCGSCSGDALCVYATPQKIQPSAPGTSPEAPTTGAAALAHKVPLQRFMHRFWYVKVDRYRFLGHRDMADLMVRALTAAQIPMLYSEGFTKLPRISFGPPLPMGCAGEHESFDLLTSCERDSSWMGINQFLPSDGLSIVKIESISPSTPSLSSQVVSARYTITPLAPCAKDKLAAALAELLSHTEIPVTRVKDGHASTKNIRPLILACTLHEEPTLHFKAHLMLAPLRTCKPSEFIKALLPESMPGDWLVMRKELCTSFL